MGFRPEHTPHGDGAHGCVSHEASPNEHDDPESLAPNDGDSADAHSPTTTGVAVLSAATYTLEDSAFASWCDTLNATIQGEARVLQDQVIELQKEFDDASQYIRGDFAWRKQVGAFHDRTNDVVTSAMRALRERLQQTTQSLSVSLGDTFKVKDALAKEEMQRQVSMYEDKLRRTRTSLKKEIDRFTHLEKCLRKEETHQAKAMYDRLVQQLTLEYAAKEATLQAMLRELKDAYVTIENANTQLMDTIKSKDEEIERLKKLLPKASATTQPKTAGTAARPGSGAFAVAAAAAASDAYAQSLKQSLQSANATIESLRKQADEAASDRETALKRQRQAEDSAARTNEELSKVKLLLSESHGALLANRKEVEVLLQEKTHWKELYADLHFQSGSHEHALDDARRLAEGAQARIQSLETQVQRRRGAELSEAALVQFRRQWRQWQEGGDGCQLSPETGMQLVDAFLTQTHSLKGSADDETSTRASEWETQLRLEFERKYGDMLNLRVSHERKRVLGRIEMIWAKRAEDCAAGSVTNNVKRSGISKDARKAQLKSHPVSSDGGSRGASLKQVLALVTEAFNDLGFSDWASMDIEMLHSENSALRGALQAQQKAYDMLQAHIEAQALSVVRADLQLREKEMLLAELTDRYRVLRAHLESIQDAHNAGNEAPAPLDLSRWDTSDPFTVYGHSQPKEEKRRPMRARPVSASATLTHSSNPEKPTASTAMARAASSASAGNRGHLRYPAPKPFLLSQLPDVATGPTASTSSSLGKTLQQQEDHVRSVLKADLLSLTPAENQLEDGSHVGADGILQIMQRRRHRK